jgi:hypothetical protein
MALGLTQPPTEMSTRNISWVKGGRCVGLTTLLPYCADCLEIWEPQPKELSGPVQACNGIALPFIKQNLVLGLDLGSAGSHSVSEYGSQLSRRE